MKVSDGVIGLDPDRLAQCCDSRVDHRDGLLRPTVALQLLAQTHQVPAALWLEPREVAEDLDRLDGFAIVRERMSQRMGCLGADRAPLRKIGQPRLGATTAGALPPVRS